MAKLVPLEVMVKVSCAEHPNKSQWAECVAKTLENQNAAAQHDAWESGMRHALAWLGLRHYGDVMAKDNPHKGAEG